MIHTSFKFTRPMLAASLLPPTVEHTDDIVLAAMKKLKYPVLASLKMDGIRAIRYAGTLVSRTLKEIPNKSIRERSIKLPAYFDMELWHPDLTFDEVESIVMSVEHEKQDMIKFCLLDVAIAGTYEQRLSKIRDFIMYSPGALDIHFSSPVLCKGPDELLWHEHAAINLHGEGICFRTPMSPYKCGRSTLNEQYLIKLARFVRTEVYVFGTYEQMQNNNRARGSGYGTTVRSKCKSALVGKNTLGGFWVRDSLGREFKVGTGVGLTEDRRKTLWQKQDELVGKTITIKHKPHGQKLLPRSPVFVGFREEGF